MFRFITFLLIVLGLGLMFAWVADNPGTIFIQWEWLAAKLGRPGEEIGVPLTLALTLLIALIVAIMLIVGMFKGIFGMPSILSRFFENRRREKGYRALSQGLIAASSGDVDTARNLAKESGKLLKNEPLVALLGTQTALLEGKRDEARENFQNMLSDESTRMVALRGLFLEAERQGEPEAARHYAEEAAREAPSLPWAGNAKLRYQAADGEWETAIQTLEANRSAGLVEKSAAKRQRAVLLTAKAMSEEQANPDKAKKLAKEAHKLARDLVPAATTFARTASRLGDIRGASKVLEASWKMMPHPELAEAYGVVRAGDSVADRLKRARKLAGLKSNHREGNLAVAVAAIDANDWDAAREALEPVLTTRPTERACLLMADIEEGQHGDRGRMRDWLSRAVRAPADEAWTADGHVSEEWLPMSPVTGEIDVFEWKVPVAQLGEEKVHVLTSDELKAEAQPIAEPEPIKDESDIIEAEAVEEDSSAKSGVVDGVAAAAVAGVAETEAETEAEAEAEAETETETETDTVDSAPDNDNMKTEEVAEADAGKESTSGSEDATSGGNVISLNTLRKDEEEKPDDEAESAAASGVEEEEAEKATSLIAEEGAEKEADDDFDNNVEFPLGRRPDDPGPHPDKEPPKKGFKLF